MDDGCQRPPLFLCSTTKHNLLKLEEWDVVSHPFVRKEWADYEESCSRCEYWVTMTREQHTCLRGLLFYDKRKAAGRGLTLRADFGPLGLLKGDRVEPHPGLINIEEFERIYVFPARALFWRRSQEAMCHHRNPMFAPAISSTPSTSAALDWLHTLSLGCF